MSCCCIVMLLFLLLFLLLLLLLLLLCCFVVVVLLLFCWFIVSLLFWLVLFCCCCCCYFVVVVLLLLSCCCYCCWLLLAAQHKKGQQQKNSVVWRFLVKDVLETQQQNKNKTASLIFFPCFFLSFFLSFEKKEHEKITKTKLYMRSFNHLHGCRTFCYTMVLGGLKQVKMTTLGDQKKAYFCRQKRPGRSKVDIISIYVDRWSTSIRFFLQNWACGRSKVNIGRSKINIGRSKVTTTLGERKCM